MKRDYKDILSNVNCQLYELYADISHACCMGELNSHKVDWILKTISDIEGYIYEKSNRRIS